MIVQNRADLNAPEPQTTPALREREIAPPGSIFPVFTTHFDPWQWIFGSPELLMLWGLFLTILTVSGYYAISFPLVLATIGAALIFRLQKSCVSIADQVVQPVISSVGQLRDDLPVIAQKAVQGIRDIKNELADNGLSLKNIMYNAQKHRIGLVASMNQLRYLDSAPALGSNLLMSASMLGIEESLVNELLSKITGAVASAGDAVIAPIEQQSLGDLLNGIPEMNSFEVKRTASLLGLAASVSNFQIGDIPVMKKIEEANRTSKALEESWTRIEEFLNEIGLVKSGKWAYMQTLLKDVDALRPEYEWVNRQMAVSPAHFCKQADYKRFTDLKRSIMEVEAILRKNTCPDLKNGKLMVSVQSMLLDIQKWDAAIAQVRSTNGIRPVPVGVAIKGDSQVGKSYLYQELSKRISEKLEALSKEDPQKYSSFANATEWQTWNMQVRDEYDQGYGGQEYTYTDDGFSDIKNEDHPGWLSFISGEAIGTVQADLASKGMAFTSRMVVVSCNTIPTKSVTINNVYALQERFPYTIIVHKKNNPPKDYDPNFSHLLLHYGKMTGSCARGQDCKFQSTGKNGPQCVFKSTTLDELVSKIATEIADRELCFQSRLRSLNPSLIVEEQWGDDDQWETIVRTENTDSEPESEDSSSDDDSDKEEEINLISPEEQDALDLGLPEEKVPVIPQFAKGKQCNPVRVARPTDANDDCRYKLRLRRLLFAAYRTSVVTSVGDSRIYTWAQFLQRGETGVPFTEWAKDSPHTSAYEFLSMLGSFQIIPGQESNFNCALLAVGVTPFRVWDKHLDTMYFWSPRINCGSIMYCIPYLQGELHEIDVSDPITRDIFTFLEMNWVPVKVFNNTEFSMFQVINHPDNQPMNKVYKWQRAIYTAGSFLFAPLPDFLINGCIRRRVDNVGLPRFSAPVFNRHLVVKAEHWGPAGQYAAGFYSSLIYVKDVIVEGWNWLAGWFKVASDAIFYSIVKILDFLGIPVGDGVEQIIGFMSEFVTSRYVILPIIGAIIYAIYKFISYLTNTGISNQGYNGQKQTKVTVRVAKMKSRQIIKQSSLPSVVSLVGDVLEKLPQEKVNYYGRTDCPFDDVSTIEADGATMDLGEYIAKPNKMPYTYVDKDWVVLSKKHCIDSPLLNKELFEGEFTAVDELADELDYSSYVIERNYGAWSSGSVPHNHIKLLWSKDLELSHGPWPKAEIVKVTNSKQGELRHLGVDVHFNVTKAGEIFDLLQPFVQKLAVKSWCFDGEVSHENCVGTFAFLSTTDPKDARDQPLTKRLIASTSDLVDLATGKITSKTTTFKQILNTIERKPERPLNVVESVSQESDDDSTLYLLRNLTAKHQVFVANGFYENQDSYRKTSSGETEALFLKKRGGALAGLATGKYVILPAHISTRIGTLVKVWKLGTNPSHSTSNTLGTFVNDPCWVAQIKFLDTCMDIAIAEFISVDDVKNHFARKGCVIDTAPMAQDLPSFPTGLEKHFVSDSTAAVLLDKKCKTVQWFPTLASHSAGIATSYGQRRYNFTSGGSHVRMYIEINGTSTNIAVSKAGDCGGLLMAFDVNSEKRVLGFHTAGNASSTFAALLTKERFEEAMRYATSFIENQMFFDIEADLKVVEGDTAGVGSEMIVNWPRVIWSDKDAFKPLICQGRGDNLPPGEGVKFLGVVKERSVPAVVMNGKFLGDWKKSPFFGTFAIQMQPAPLAPYDPRIVKELPLNSAGKPSLLAGPNNLYGAVMPRPDEEILTKVMNETLEFWVAYFSGKKIGYPEVTSTIEMLDEALNGNITNKFMTGLEVNSSSGYPWTMDPSTAKKSQLIDVDVCGYRSFANNQGGRALQKHCILKLEEAQCAKRLTSFCTSKLKDTLIKNEHVEIGKTRVFNAGSIDDLILSNAVLGRFREAYTVAGKDMNHAIGINVHSNEWRDLYEYLAVFPNWLDIDYANFDKHLLSQFLRVAEWLGNETIDRVCPDSWRLARYVVSENAINSIMLDDETVYMTEHGNKSGEGDTTPRNSKVNFLMMFYVFKKITGEDLACFRNHVRFVTFGDDIVMTVSDLFKDKFHFNTIQSVLGDLGQVVTPSKKMSGPVPDFSPLEDITFLKRRFAILNGIVVSPLEKRSIESKYGWSKNKPEHTGIWEQIVDNDLLEACQWGQAYYDDFRCKLLAKIGESTFPVELRNALIPYLIRNFQTQWDILKGKKALLTFNSDDTEINTLIRESGTTLYEVLDRTGVAELDTRLLRVESTIQRISQEYDDLRSLINTLSGNVSSLSTKVSNISGSIVDIQDSIATLNTETAGLTSTITEVSDDVTDLTTTVTDLTTLTSDLEVTVLTLNTGLTDITNRVVALENSSSLDVTATSIDGESASTALNYLIEKVNTKRTPLGVTGFSSEIMYTQVGGTTVANDTGAWYVPIDSTDQPGAILAFPDLTDMVKGGFKTQSDVDLWFESASAAGAIISDIGKPILVDYQGLKFPAFQLRSGKKQKLPGHHFGKCILGDTFSFPHLETLALPATGSSVLIEPTVTNWQTALMNIYDNIRGDGIIIVGIDEPLGANHLMLAEAPEINLLNTTRGVRWKPAAIPVVAFVLPWRNDVALNARTTSRPGNPGLGIKLTTLENNTVTSVSVPITAFIYKMVCNVSLTRLRSVDVGNTAPAGLLFRSIAAPTEIEEETTIELQMDAGDGDPQANADQGQSNVPVESVVATEGVPETLPAEEIAGKAPASGVSSQTKKPATSAMNARWTLWQTLVFTQEMVGQEGDLSFDPINLDKGGDSFMRPFRRNVWFSGDRELGYVQLYRVKAVSNRAPQIAGRILFKNSSTNCAHRVIHKFGGDPTEFSLIPSAFQGNGNVAIRFRGNPWLRTTSDRVGTGSWQLVSFNRTDDISNYRVKLFVKPGGVVFSVPTKARKRPTTTTSFESVVAGLGEKKISRPMLEMLGLLLENTKIPVIEEQMFDPGEDDDSDLTPAGNATGDLGRVQEDLGIEEPLDQNDFWVRIGTYNLPLNGNVIRIPLDLRAIGDDFGAGGPSPIRERCMRYANIIPQDKGNFGPTIGKYAIQCHLPTGIAGNLAHVAIPGDMNDEVALRFFGLSSLASLAGTALQSIGGPLLSGAVNALGGVASGLLGGLLGTDTKQEAPASVAEAPPQAPQSIGGKIPIGRFFDFLKTANVADDGQFGNLLVQALDVIFNTVDSTELRANRTNIPIVVYAHIGDDEMNLERQLIDRVDIVENPSSLEVPLLLTVQELGSFIQGCAQHGSEYGDTLALKALKLAHDTIQSELDFGKSIDVTHLRDISLPTSDELLRISSLLAKAAESTQ